MANWMAAKRSRAAALLWHAVACMSERDEKDRREGSPKASVLVLICLPLLIGHRGVNSYLLGAALRHISSYFLILSLPFFSVFFGGGRRFIFFFSTISIDGGASTTCFS